MRFNVPDLVVHFIKPSFGFRFPVIAIRFVDFVPQIISTALNAGILNKEFILENSEIKIVNVLGEEILKQKLFSKKQMLVLTELNNGIYFLQLIQQDRIIVTKKIVKQ